MLGAPVVCRRYGALLGESVRKINVPGLVNIQKTMENHHAINGKTHYFYGHFQ